MRRSRAPRLICDPEEDWPAATTAANDMTKLMRERIDTKGSYTEELCSADRQSGNQLRQEPSGWLDQEAKCVRKPVAGK